MADKKTGLKLLKSDAKLDKLTTHDAMYHLESSVPKGAHVVVEVAAPLATLVYDQGTVEDGKLDLKFPVPKEEGDILLRVVTVSDKDGERKLVDSRTL
jgi:hypothetical protein